MAEYLPSDNFSSELAQNLEPALVIALSEHLNWISENPDNCPHSADISQSVTAFDMADGGFGDLEREFAGRIAEWQQKWELRFATEGTARVLAERSREIGKIASAREREQLGNSLYFDSVHLMVGDSQKLLVTLASRAELLQEKIRKTWHKNCPSDAYSKILPVLEASLQECEGKFFGSIRDELSKNAMRKFLETFAGSAKGGLPALEHGGTAALHFYFLDFSALVQRISFELCRFYSKKWALFARGFSVRQNQIPLG